MNPKQKISLNLTKRHWWYLLKSLNEIIFYTRERRFLSNVLRDLGEKHGHSKSHMKLKKSVFFNKLAVVNRKGIPNV